MFWSQTEWILVVCRSARLVRKNIVKLGSSRKFCNLKAILFHLIYSFTHLSALCSWSSSTLLRLVFGRLGIEHLWGSGCGCLIWCLVKNGAPQLMGQEYTCPELQYKVPSVLVKVLTPSKQMENAMNIMKIWEKLQKKKKKRKSVYISVPVAVFLTLWTRNPACSCGTRNRNLCHKPWAWLSSFKHGYTFNIFCYILGNHSNWPDLPKSLTLLYPDSVQSRNKN